MKTKPEHEQLLNEIVSEEAAGFRAASLQRTLASARRHRQARAALRVGGGMAAAIALASAAWWHWSPAINSVENPSVAVTAAQPVRETVPGTSIQVVSDEELLAMFGDRPVAIVGPPENRQFVFLDEQARANNRSPRKNHL